jgi:DNA replication protein DnaC
MPLRTPAEIRARILQRWANIPPQYLGNTLDDFDRKADPAAYDAVAKYLTRDWTWRSAKGLLLVGGPGRGKTLLATVALQEAMRHNQAVRFETLAGYVKHHQALIKAEKHEDEEEVERLETLIYRCENFFRFLVLDDVGKEYRSATGYAGAVFDNLIRTRYSQGLPTILTTNVPVARWDKEYSEAMRSYVQEACVLVPFVGPDFRSN